MSIDADDAVPGSAATRLGLRHLLAWLAAVALIVVVVVLVWNQGKRLIDGQASGLGSYLIVVALVFGDALCPVLPGETTLNAACVLAANGKLNLGLVMLSGAVGAVVGDSTLYWLSRSARGRVRVWLDHAGEAKAGASVVTTLNKYGNIFLLFGRYVPGLRFALNVTLGGVVRMPYPRFLLWSGLSGTLWAIWTCISAYYSSSALAGYPVASLVVSTFAGTVLIASFVWVQSRISRRHRAVDAAATG